MLYKCITEIESKTRKRDIRDRKTEDEDNRIK